MPANTPAQPNPQPSPPNNTPAPHDFARLADLPADGKTALVRLDLNVPFRPGTTDISDDARIRAAIPTINSLRQRRCKLILCSHLGRPKGRPAEELRMQPISRRLSQLLAVPVQQAPDCIGDAVKAAAAALAPGEILMLENLRFHPGEERNDSDFAAQLASLADIFVNDAFGAAHRAHASTAGVPALLPAAAGILMEAELRALGGALNAPNPPFAAILGGAKVSDKIAVLQNLVAKADALIIGGGMAATFIKAQGNPVGDSLIEPDKVDFAREIIAEAQDRNVNLLLPQDAVIADAFAETAAHRVAPAAAVPDRWRIMDIGPQTAAQFAAAIAHCRTAIWNGPMGVFEWPPFAAGTAAVANALASLTTTPAASPATTVIGGGSTAEAVAALNLTRRMTHVSSGGGASLEFLEGKTLPGVAALRKSPAD